MRTLGPKSLSTVAFFSFRIIAILTLLLVIYIDFSFLTNNFRIENGRFFIKIPLLGTNIEGDYQFNIILTISLGLLFATIFFYVISNIFEELTKEHIFSKIVIRHLRFFTILNLVVGPILYFMIHYPIMHKTNFGDIHNLILHLIFGLISLFLVHIFKKGQYVQSENDLTI
ncbi:DUF2975 domain-containing protein [Maribacter sp. CXY002]|uniref:DUF2975 domain-containing protein n=1 Tax=Maribacter luteocoastalis TaxID=3407671 RepID=UPI003B66B56E